MEKAEKKVTVAQVWVSTQEHARNYYYVNRLGTMGPRNQESVVFFFFETRKIKASLQ